MSFAQKLERLARILPGVAGYQDKETSRDTDKTIRLRLAAELEEIKRDLEHGKHRLMEEKELSLLAALDEVASKLDRLGNLTRYASRGYRGLFDVYKLSQKKLDDLQAFDLRLFNELESVKAKVKDAEETYGDQAALRKAIDQIAQSLDSLERLLAARKDILTAE